MVTAANPRLRRYTNGDMKKLKCFRCGSNQPKEQWQICSDGNQWRPVCIPCDIELNKLVLEWARFPNWKEMFDSYRVAKFAEYGIPMEGGEHDETKANGEAEATES